MSGSQLLLTLGVALWVFDARKIPRLVAHLAELYGVVHEYYRNIVEKCDTVLQQELQKLTLERNELKAKAAEDQPP